jgi:DNA-directed RNA polymerase subunit L
LSKQKNKIMLRKIEQNFTLCNILDVTLEHNGFQGGDAGHGGYVKMNFRNQGAAIEVNGKQCEKVELIFRGDTERVTLVDALKMIVKELEEHKEGY